MTLRYRKADYVPCDSVPTDLKWKPAPGRDFKKVVMLSLGNLYKLERSLATGAVTYYKHKSVDEDKGKSPAEKIDAEPKKERTLFRTGTRCWYVETGLWFCVDIVRRTDKHVVIKPVTGWDADKHVPWGYSEELEIPANGRSPLYQRLRKLSDKVY